MGGGVKTTSVGCEHANQVQGLPQVAAGEDPLMSDGHKPRSRINAGVEDKTRRRHTPTLYQSG